jgi:hypothetical protein
MGRFVKSGTRSNYLVNGKRTQINALQGQWEENYNTFKTLCNVDQALKKQIITVFEPMYLDILNDGMVGFANTSAHEILSYLFATYGSITGVDLD